MGHLKFAEKWLIRLEHELSERSRKYLEYAVVEGDMIASMQRDSDNMIQVVYGEEGSARHGGIDGVPRYGAASFAPDNPTASSSKVAKRRKSFDIPKPSPSRSEKPDKSEDGGSMEDKNMWKSWKNLLSQLSSPDGVPPPLVEKRGRNGSGKVEEADFTSFNGSAGSSSPSSSDKKTTLPRRSKSPFGKRMSRSTGKSTPPPLPNSPSPALNGRTFKDKTHRPGSFDADNEDLKTNWGTDTSVSGSIMSTAPSSLSHKRVGSQSSRKSVNPVRLSASGSSSNGHNPWKATPQLAKPSVTSEVLMADSPVITRVVPTSASVTPSSSSTNHAFSQQVGPKNANNEHNGSPGVQEILPLPRRSVGPSDVPEDARPDEEEIVTPSLIPNLSKPMPQIPNQGSDTPISTLTGSRGMARNASGDSSMARRSKKVQPPIVNSQYGPQTWDTTYSSRSNDGHDGLQTSADSDLTATGYHANASYRQRPRSHTVTSSMDGLKSPSTEAILLSSPEVPGLSHPYSNGRLSRSSSISPLKASHHPLERQRTNTNNSVTSGTNLVLQSLSPANGSQASLHGSADTIAASPTSIVQSISDDGNKIRIIPRKAPPPMYAPPQPPIKQQSQQPVQDDAITPTRADPILYSKNSPDSSDPHQQHRQTNPLLLVASRSSSSSEGQGYSPTNTFTSSFQPSSRRASAAESIQSAGTFG